MSGIAEVDYTVTVTPDGSSDGGWVVEGVISVFNPNQSIEMVATVTDSNPGTDCTAPNGTDVVIGGGQTVDVAYSCEFSTQPDLNGQNTASVRWKDAAGTLGIDAEKRNDVSYTSADWSITEIYDVVDVVDDKTDPANPVHLGVAAWNADGTPTVFEYLLPLHVDTVGCVEFTNTAWLDWHHQQAVETVEVCRGEVPAQNLVVSQSVDASFDRTYLWSIDKAADDRWPEADPVSGIAEVDYTVTVTPDGSSDGGWVISGMVSVYNPNDESVTVATDVTHNGVPCSVPGGPFILVGADSTAERPYSCVFSDQPSYDGTTRATVTRVMGYVTPSTSVANETAYSSADWSLTEIDDVIEVIDDQTDPANPVNLGDAVWNAEGTPTVFEYLLPLHVDPDECVEFTNTAWIDQSPQQAVETVEVCRGEDQARNLVVDHSVLMSLERTNLWSINKETEGSPQVNPASGIAM